MEGISNVMVKRNLKHDDSKSRKLWKLGCKKRIECCSKIENLFVFSLKFILKLSLVIYRLAHIMAKVKAYCAERDRVIHCTQQIASQALM